MNTEAFYEKLDKEIIERINVYAEETYVRLDLKLPLGITAYQVQMYIKSKYHLTWMGVTTFTRSSGEQYFGFRIINGNTRVS